MRRFSAPNEVQQKYQPGVESFLRSLKQHGLSKQQLKTLRGQALTGDLAGALKGLERMVTRNEHN